MKGKARDAQVVPRAGKGGDGACRRAARVSPCPWGDHEEAHARALAASRTRSSSDDPGAMGDSTQEH